MKIKLSETSANPPKELDKKLVKEETKKIVSAIGEIQKQLYAQKKYSILVVLQGMDASGKDGILNKVFKEVNPHGLKVAAFKKPTDEEFSHDFLWRIHKKIPQKGQIVVFNRSHYEDILVPSVYQYIDQELIEKRYDHINNFEKLIEDNDTKILKFYLNVSPEKQKERLTERIELEEKNWKHSDGDWKVVADRTKFEAVYEQIFDKCNVIPWTIVPADTNWCKSYIVAKAVLEALKEMKLSWPPLKTEKQWDNKDVI